MGKSKKRGPRRPKILVLEALGGSSACVAVAGGDSTEISPSFVSAACRAIDSHDWDGLLLTGGGDVDPRMYGQRPRKEVYGVSENRDLVETYALQVARERDVPVLGICRGAQIINVEAGGTLRQHIGGHRGTEHAILTREGTIMRDYAELNPRVVSLHHQRIEDVANGYEVSSRASDGTIESIEATSGRVLGVQFHPEMDDMEPYAQGIFRWLVEESATRAGLPHPSKGSVPARRQKSGYRPSKHHTVDRSGKVGKTPASTRGHATQYNGVRTFWACPQCTQRFDKAQDRDDHVSVMHEGWVVSGDGTVVPPESKRGSRRVAGEGSTVRVPA